MAIATENKRPRRNEEITSPRLRVIGSNGAQAGVLSRYEALNLAQAEGLDLIEVSPTADPPVVRILDWGKFHFEQNKKAHAAHRAQHHVHIKETQFRPNTGLADIQVKVRHIIEFLSHGDKAKVVVKFKGREMAHQDIGRRLLASITEQLADLATIEQPAMQEGKQLIMLFGPKKH